MAYLLFDRFTQKWVEYNRLLNIRDKIIDNLLDQHRGIDVHQLKKYLRLELRVDSYSIPKIVDMLVKAEKVEISDDNKMYLKPRCVHFGAPHEHISQDRYITG
jgi:hypothetical protein